MLRLSLYLFVSFAVTGCVRDVAREAGAGDVAREAGAGNDAREAGAGNDARDEAHDHSDWTYGGAHGPDHWAEAYPACGEPGESPIDIVSAEPADLPALEPRYQSVQGTVNDGGHAILVNTEGGKLILGDREYGLKQFHFHIPSEHRFDGARYEAVIHLVHSDADGRLAVVGVPVTSGEGSPLMEVVLGALESSNPNPIQVSGLIPQDLTYFTYEGSLTTPPCTGGVKWIVLANPVTWSSDQINRLSRYYHGNVRSVQPVGDRKILKSGE